MGLEMEEQGMKADGEKQAERGGSKERRLALLQGARSPLKGVGKERTMGFGPVLKLKDARDPPEILRRSKFAARGGVVSSPEVVCTPGWGARVSARCTAGAAGSDKSGRAGLRGAGGGGLQPAAA